MRGVHGGVQAGGPAGWHLCRPAERGWAVGPGVGRVLHPEIQSHQAPDESLGRWAALARTSVPPVSGTGE